MQQKHIIAVILPCVTTPMEDTIVPAMKGFIGDGENCSGEILPYKHVYFATFQLAPNLQVVSSLAPFKTISTERSSK